jgi:hypothetical protein
VTGGGWYTSGTAATLNATAASGYSFANFSGSITTTTTNPLTLTVTGATNIVANFSAPAPALSVAVGNRTNDVIAGDRDVVLVLTNTGLGTAYNAQISSITAITDVSGSGAVTLVSGLPGPSPSVQLAPSGSVNVPLVFNWPTTATRVSITVRMTATDFTGTVTYPVTQTVTTFR